MMTVSTTAGVIAQTQLATPTVRVEDVLAAVLGERHGRSEFVGVRNGRADDVDRAG